ncbi:hypothetical protein Hanom_Chr15g01345631 [Helianthus anomalus]
MRGSGAPSVTPCGNMLAELGGCRHQGRREGGDGPMNFFFFNKKTIHLRGVCRHQFRVLGEFKRRVDVTHEDWWDVTEESVSNTLSNLVFKNSNGHKFEYLKKLS